MGEWMVLLFAISKKYDKVLYTPHNWLSPSLNNCHLHEISLFFVLSTYVETILMRWLHDLIVTKLCQTPGDRLWLSEYGLTPWFRPFRINPGQALTPKNSDLCFRHIVVFWACASSSTKRAGAKILLRHMEGLCTICLAHSFQEC